MTWTSQRKKTSDVGVTARLAGRLDSRETRPRREKREMVARPRAAQVPGSMIAKLWFNSIFPPPLEAGDDDQAYILQDNVFSNLMVISTSLALGLILGFAFVRVAARFLFWLCCCGCGPCCDESLSYDTDRASEALSDDEKLDLKERAEAKEGARDRFAGMFTAPNEDPEDPAKAHAL